MYEKVPNKLGYKNSKHYTFWLKNFQRVDILLQITLLDNKAAILMMLHLCFKVNSITHLFHNAAVTY